MKIYNLGKVAWVESQLIYHALAHLGREALSLVSPATPYVCIGFHQEASQEVDLSYCTAHEIPVFRRDLGGGAVYLDGDQLFFHLILHKDNPAVPKRKEMFYKKFLQPVIEVYRRIGIPAEYKPINDVIVGTRKISGTGVGEIRDCIVFVGNLIVDFNYDMMARVLRVPDEKFRDKVHKTLTENLSTMRRELGKTRADQWGETELNALLAEEFERLLGPMEACEKDDALKNKMNELSRQMMTDDWLFQKGKRVAGRDIKIREGTKLVHKMHKAPGGLMRADFGLQDGRFTGVNLSGDFFCFPADAIDRLEKDLEGRRSEEAASLLAEFYDEKRMDTPGIGLEDWLEVLKD